MNAAAKDGELRVEILGEDDKPLGPIPVRVACRFHGHHAQPRSWQEADSVADLAGQTIRFRFHLRNGALFSFWVSPSESGASNGYVAAGGPGFTGHTDI